MTGGVEIQVLGASYSTCCQICQFGHVLIIVEVLDEYSAPFSNLHYFIKLFLFSSLYIVAQVVRGFRQETKLSKLLWVDGALM